MTSMPPPDPADPGTSCATPLSPLNPNSRVCDPGPSTSAQAMTPTTPTVTPERPKGGRPKTKRTPRTMALIDRMRTREDKLRKRLFRAETRAAWISATMSRPQIIQGASRYLSKQALEIFRAQLYLHPVHKYGRQWPLYFRGFALKLYSMSPRAYRYLSAFLTLPTVRMLRAWLGDMVAEPGVQPAVIDRLEEELKDLPLKDRTCTLVFDEMSIKEHLQYDRGSDMIFGYVDNGRERTREWANSALLVMLSGISSSWVQPLSYALSRSTASADTLKALLMELIQMLHSAAIFVKAVICDQGASNLALARNIGVTPSQPYFCVGDSKVYFIFDPPHLMKTTRNLLLTHDLLNGCPENKVQWSFIKQLHDSNHPLKIRVAPKLTENHVKPTVFNRMRVKLATQVFSNSVSAIIATLIALGELPPAAAATADFLLQMDVLFDTLNSSSVEQGDDRKMRFAMSASTEHKAILQSAAERIRNWKFLDSPREPPTVKGWQITINAVLALWDDLHENFEFEHLLTRRLNQDPIENMFGQFRQMHGSNETPNAVQFVAGVKRTMACKLVQVAGTGNCEPAELSLLLNELRCMPVPSETSLFHEEMVPERDLAPADPSVSSPLSLVEINAQFAYAGSLVDTFLETSKCSSCTERLRSTEGDLETPPGVLAHLLDEGQACAPWSAFFE